MLAPGAAFPPITLGVRVAESAPAVITTAPRVTGRSGNVWIDTTSDRISTGAPVPGDVGGTVPATLALTLGGPATFAPFVPGVARSYTAATTATVTSTAGEAALTVADPGRLTNGAFALAAAAAGRDRAERLERARGQRCRGDHVHAGDRRRPSRCAPGPTRRTLVFTLSTTTP